jgi:hypothetical protein
MRTPASPAFAESTISAVQASLHKYQLQIHELQVGTVTLGVFIISWHSLPGFGVYE